MEKILHAKFAELKAEYDVLAGWRLFINPRLRAIMGKCSYHTKTVHIAKWILGAVDEAEIMDTLLHEVAHAIVGHEAGHGPKWKAQARKIGGRGNRLGKAPTKAIPSRANGFKYGILCPNCGILEGHGFYRRPKYEKRHVRCGELVQLLTLR